VANGLRTVQSSALVGAGPLVDAVWLLSTTLQPLAARDPPGSTLAASPWAGVSRSRAGSPRFSPGADCSTRVDGSASSF
jgi:hypothetical protein